MTWLLKPSALKLTSKDTNVTINKISNVTINKAIKATISRTKIAISIIV